MRWVRESRSLYFQIYIICVVVIFFHVVVLSNMNYFQTELFESSQVLQLRVRVELGVMSIKKYSPKQEPLYQMQLSVIPRTLLLWGRGVLLLHNEQVMY